MEQKKEPRVHSCIDVSKDGFFGVVIEDDDKKVCGVGIKNPEGNFISELRVDSLEEAYNFIKKFKEGGRYTITTVELRANWEKQLEIGNTERNPGFKFQTVKSAKDLCKQLRIKEYYIIDIWKSDMSDVVVYQTQGICDILNREIKERSEEKKEKEKRVIEINKLPVKFPFKEYTVNGKKLVIYFQRSKAEYRPSYSRNIQCVIRFKFVVDGTESPVWLHDFVTSDRRFLRKKFEEKLLEVFFEWCSWRKEPKKKEEMEAVSPIVGDLGAMREMEKELVRKIS